MSLAGERMAQTSYDVVFLDWDVPGRSGYSLLRQFRMDSRYDDVAFIIVSAVYEASHIIVALQAGATSYLVKPVNEGVLKEQVNRLLEWIGEQKMGASFPA